MLWLKQSTAVVLRNVRPAGSIKDAADVAPLDAESVGNSLLGFTGRAATANLTNYGIREFGGTVILTIAAAIGVAPAVPNHVRNVVRAGAPIEVFEPVVSRDSVPVTSLASVRARANERFQNKVMDVPKIAPPEDNNRAAVLFGPLDISGLKLFPVFAHSPLTFPARPDRSVVANTVAGVT